MADDSKPYDLSAQKEDSATTTPHTAVIESPSVAAAVEPAVSQPLPVREQSEERAATATAPVQPPPTTNSLPPTQPAPTADANDAVGQLHSMFPTIDRETIEDVLAGERGDADAAVPLLLMLTGQGDAISVGEISAPGSTWQQMVADEALARQIAREESHSQNSNNLAYEPRRSRPDRSQQNYQQGNYERDEYQENTRSGREELDQVMETVKATADKAKQFGTGLFNTLQTKFKEMQVAREQQTQQQQSSGSQWPSDNSSTNARVTEQYDAVGNVIPNRTSRASGFQRTLSTSPQSQPATGPPRISGSMPHSNRYARPSPNKTAQSTAGTSPLNTAPISMRSTLAANTSHTDHSPEATVRSASPSANLGQSPLAKNTIGDWQSKRISLVDNSTGNSQKRNVIDSDDDDLDAEYVRNPFEDRDD